MLNPKWMAKLLRRSGTLPLLVVCHILPTLYDEQMEALAVVLGQLSRIQTLHMTSMCTYPHPSSLIHLLSCSAPLLHTLSLCGPLLGEQDDESAPSVYRPALLHPDRTPRLGRLNQMGPHYGISLSGPCASTLKHLNVKTVYKGDTLHWPDITILLDVLSATLSLETLSFKRHRAWRVFGQQTVLLTTTSLPCLHTLALQMQNNELCTVLQCLDLPAPMMLP